MDTKQSINIIDSNESSQSLKIKQLLSLYKASIPSHRIQKILGLTSVEIEELESSDSFREAELGLIETDNKIDSAWDSLEKKALTSIAIELSANPDPLFALQVAKTANSASRRARIIADRNAKPAVAAAISQYNTLSQSSQTTIINLDKRTLELLQSDRMGRLEGIKEEYYNSIESGEGLTESSKIESTACYSDAMALLNPNMETIKNVTADSQSTQSTHSSSSIRENRTASLSALSSPPDPAFILEF